MNKIFACFLIFFTMSIFAQDKQLEQNKYNETHRPYLGYSLVIKIKSISLTKLSVSDKKIFGSMMFPITKKCEIQIENNTYSINTGNETLSHNTNDYLLLLLKYLGPFLYSNIVEENTDVVESRGRVVFSYEYIYKGESCINKFTFFRGKLEKAEVYIEGNDTPSVVTKYSFINHLGKKYLESFQSENIRNPNKLTCRVYYQTTGEILLPIKIMMQTEAGGNCFLTNYEIECCLLKI